MSYWKQRCVLVTGGGGFIGLNLIPRLLEQGARVRVAETFERGRSDRLADFAEIELIDGDLRDASVCSRACRDVEVVFHLASKVGSSEFYRRFPADVVLHNTLLDSQLLEAARSQRVVRYLHVSSAFVYPLERQTDPHAAALREEEAYPPNPANSYGWAKLMAERALAYAVDQDAQLTAVILRLSNVYGPHQSIDLERGSLLPVLVRRAVEYPRLSPFSIKGSGQETRTYCHVSDAVEAMLLAVEKLDRHRLLGPLNIGSEEPVRVVDLARRVIAVSGKDIELVTLPAAPPVTQSQTLDCSKARDLLDGWRPAISLEEGLRTLYRHVESELAGRPSWANSTP
jgi:nucleoside-diphosphate-sugar epimerase